MRPPDPGLIKELHPWRRRARAVASRTASSGSPSLA
jgi:hypothetical protein